MAKNITYKTRSKYGNKKIEIDGKKFDSKLELYCYNMLKQLKIPFEFQKKEVLMGSFRYNGKAVREITLTVDFVAEYKQIKYYIDTKGFATEVSKMKYKMLKNQLKGDMYTDVVWLKNQKEVQSFINKLIKDGNN
jgi:uncharacterized GH25 family protein